MEIIETLLDKLAWPLTDRRARENAYKSMSPAARANARAKQATIARSPVVSLDEVAAIRALEIDRSRANHPTSQSPPKTK